MEYALVLALPLLFSASPARAQGPGPVTVESIELNSANFLDQLAYSPDFLAAPDTSPVTEDDVRDLEEDEDSDAYLYISSAAAHMPEPLNLGGNGNLTLRRNDTGEKITVRYRLADGTYDGDALERLNRFMRCRLTGREAPMALKLVELLDAVEDKFGRRGLILLSGYRTPKLNGKIRGSAKHSMHMLGWAADIKVPGYSSTKIKKFGQKLGVGGVGYYPYKGFTHLDVGRSRYWAVSRPPRRRARRKAKRPAAKSAPRKAPAAARKLAAKPGRSR
ncbi:MAG: YcbK family protein [Elusimicrobia bacterium]|nr:YcbK family protein [Elusimicrobiota bacterium]